MDNCTRILHLEDDATDAELVHAVLESAGMPCRITRVETRDQFAHALRSGGFDVILADFRLPTFDGVSALRMAQELAADVPFIFVSGTMGEDAAIEGLTQGATDFVLKQKLSRLAPAMKRVLREAENSRERKRVEAALRESEAQFRTVFDNAGDGMFVFDLESRKFVICNAACSRMLGFAPEEFRKQQVGDLLLPEDVPLISAQIRESGREEEGVRRDIRFKRKDGSTFFADPLRTLISLGGRKGILVTFRDITERKRAEQEKLELERRLLHAQKLESLGILAGGIAHDFNNILAGIMGYADLALMRLPTSEPARADIQVIKDAVQRAAGLTRQMLAYSGKGKFIVEPVSLSRIVQDMRGILEISISKKAELKCNLASDLPTIQADASQVHQVILNLVINASEALGEESGVIVISTDAIQCNAADCAAIGGGPELREGTYVRLEVADTGCGMDEQTRAKVFDPFFTTKFTGRGLGLAAVHGIVRGHKGGIQVSSAVGKGTTFQVLFPASNASAALAASESTAGQAWRGSGTVLVVDDEEIVRNLAKRLIERVGLSVLTANDGEEAICVYRQHEKEIACVLLDLTMPRMSGEETFLELRRINPEVRVILSSGYSEESATGRFAGLGLAGFIQKPYLLDTMIAKLRAAIVRAR